MGVIIIPSISNELKFCKNIYILNMILRIIFRHLLCSSGHTVKSHDVSKKNKIKIKKIISWKIRDGKGTWIVLKSPGNLVALLPLFL